MDEIKSNEDGIGFSKVANTITTIATVCASIGVSIMNHSFIGVFSILMVFIVLPTVYSMFRLTHSDCINVDEIIDRGICYDDIMQFNDTRRNCSVGDFLDEMHQRANFWVTLISISIAFLTFINH